MPRISNARSRYDYGTSKNGLQNGRSGRYVDKIGGVLFLSGVFSLETRLPFATTGMLIQFFTNMMINANFYHYLTFKECFL